MSEQHLCKTQQALKEQDIPYRYLIEDGCASIDFTHRGLRYHIWEYADRDLPCGVETNLFHAGRSEEIEDDYDTILSLEIMSW